jgi:Fe-S-cluster containining protein
MTLQTLPVDFDEKMITPENKCSFCKGSMCCTYITQEIETPHTKKDYSHLLWQVSHEHVKIYKDKDSWNLLIEGRCAHLQPGGRCGIYDSRPYTCRKHSNDYCEFDAPLAGGFKLYFPTYDSLLEYCKKKFKNWDGKKKAKKADKKKKKKRGKKSGD